MKPTFESTGVAPSTVETIRLSKRVAALFSCSRSEAERYIEGGWVCVDGEVVELPQFRVGTQSVTLSEDASLASSPSVTLIYHRPTGQSPGGLPDISARWSEDRSGVVVARRHFKQMSFPCPLEAAACGLVVLTQDWRITRKLTEGLAYVEQEIIVEVAADDGGPAMLSANGLRQLNHGLSFCGKSLPPVKVSWQSENTLRFALKNPLPGQIADMCSQVGIKALTMKRIRIGRVPMAALPVGKWRCLGERERF